MKKIFVCCTILLLLLSCAEAPKAPLETGQIEAPKSATKQKISELQHLICPVENGSVGSRRRPPVMGLRDFGKRLAINGAVKASVFSVLDGIVSAVYPKTDRIIISSGDLAIEYRYFDVDPSLKKGATIKKGDRIGQIYHLKSVLFLVSKGGEPIMHDQYSFECEE